MAPSATSQLGSPASNTKEKKNENSLWEIKSIAGKGKGIVAIQDITPGTLLLSEEPLITTECITSIDFDLAEYELETELKKLPMDSQKALRVLHNNYPDDEKHKLTGVMRSNGYPLGTDASVGGAFATISRINHSCVPNVVQHWNVLMEKEIVYAIRHITAGEEITTSYLIGGPSSERRTALKEYFGFDCGCVQCSQSPDSLKISDDRLGRAQMLDKMSGDSKTCHFDPYKALRASRDILNIYNSEGISDGRLSRLYYDCFQLCNMHSDLARARCFAKYFCDAKQMAEGSESENVLEMKPFVKNPARHSSYGSTHKWKTTITDVPKGLKPKEFAKWLWRESEAMDKMVEDVSKKVQTSPNGSTREEK